MGPIGRSIESDVTAGNKGSYRWMWWWWLWLLYYNYDDDPGDGDDDDDDVIHDSIFHSSMY